LKSESERNYLKQEAEELKKKLIGMVKVLESRDNQMTKIDQKIEELIRLRQELTSTKENDLNSLLNF
jgi:ppGpp synthetase/RelA/SpoT-type nucleotidyltranferase